MRSQPLRFTIPKSVASSNAVVLTIPTSGLTTPLVNLTVTGVPGSGNAAAFLSQSLINSNGTTSVTLSLTNDATITAGDYDLAVVATGDANFRLPVPVEVDAVWNGSASTAFGATGNWIGGVAPSTTDHVIFRDTGGQAATSPTNIVVAANAEVASIRFAPEASGTRFHNMEILSGAKLLVSGSGLAFSLHRDSKLVAQNIDVLVAGGGTLEMSNPNAEFGILLDGQRNTTLDMRNLNNFNADIKRMGIGNYRIWPNYYTNGYVGSGGAAIANPPTRFVPLVWLAKTNVIKCSWADPNNYNDGGVRDYAIDIGNDEASGTTTAIRFTLGTSNAFFIDSICWSHSGKGGSANNYNFNAAGSYALFRGIGGGRMPAFVLGDASGVGPSGSNVRGTTVDFGNGQVDAMVDRLLLGRSRTNTTGMTIQGTLTIGGASLGTVFDVNTAILGQQDFDNLGTGAGAVSGPVGTINVNSNATLKVNGDLHLGFTVATSISVPTYPENCSGVLNINNSGTVMASNILAGGVTKLSVLNNISVNNSGKLIVTNQLGTSDGRINSLTLANNAQLTLLGTTVGQTKVYVKTLAAATACNINVPSISGYTSGDVTISLISYVTGSPVISGLTITPPPGLFIKSIIDNSGTIDVTFTDRPPLVLIWRGNVNNIWSTSATDKNWITAIGSLQTNFVDGDSVIFDDTATGPTTIDISGTVTPGQTAAAFGIVVNNITKNYAFNASGNVTGSSTLRKTGTGSLTVDALFSPGVSLGQGSLAGAATGTVGPTVLGDGTTMTAYAGTINGGLSASNATVAISGTVNGGLKLQAGSLVNNGTISGPFTLATNVTLINNPAANLYVVLPWSVPTNSTLVNNGTIKHSGTTAGNQGLTVNGNVRGVGVITQFGTNQAPDVRVTLGAGGNLTIGNSANEITNMTIAVRLDFLAGSTATFDVNTATATNDIIVLTDVAGVGKVNFGAGNGLGGKIVINKTAGPDFNLLTALNLFDKNSNIPDNTAQAIPGVVPAPAPGLVWDVSRTISNLTVAVMGPPALTNQITSTNITFTWPESYRGWRLERQISTLAVGLESPSTNWTTVASSFGGSYSNANVVIDSTTNILYFQATQPIDKTNGSVFLRLNYP